jgi:hypothetical protein
VEVLTRELTTELMANHLAFRDKELVNKEKGLAKRQPQELATGRKSLE